MGSVEARCSRPLTLRTFGGYPVGRKLSIEQGSRPSHTPWLGMFERSPVVLVETSTCRNRRSARGLEDVRE
jgi:hypothetical protein